MLMCLGYAYANICMMCQSRFVLVFLLCIGFSIIHEALAFYSSGSGVIDLTPSNFQKEVINGDEIWIVEFYAPWCGHCQSLVPEYQKAAKSLRGIIKIGAVNADEHKSLAGQYGVSGFPTIKIFGLNKNKPEDYQGPRSSQGFIDAAMKVIKEKISVQSGQKAGSGGAGGGSADDVIELTDGNFDKNVLQSEDMWLVEFFAPWCGHCKNLAPHWQQAASELKGKAKLGALDATVHTIKASQYEVRGYPTIKFFYKGEVEDYAGGRTASDIIAWANDKLSVNVEPPKVYEAVNQEVLETACKEHPICIIAVLPHILDCQSECRNKHINMLLKLGDKYKKKQWGYVWVEALAQPALEECLGIGGFGYPALAAINAKKMQFALLRGSFSFDGVNEFLRDISFGRGRTAPVNGAKLPTLATNAPWDGKDGELPVEDDIDLSDIDLDKDEL